jgi:membrane protein DedA with SNARE-associated domain
MSDAALLAIITHHGVPIVALMIFAGELGVPTGIPIEIALLLAGSYAVDSFPTLLLSLALVGLADFLGTSTLYLVARTGGVRLFAILLRRHTNTSDVFTRWRRRLGGHDIPVIFVLRILPLVRMWASLGAGLLSLPVRAFVLGAAPASLVWAGLPLTLGYLLGPEIKSLTARVLLVSHTLVVVVPALLGVAALLWWLRRGHSLHARLLRGRSLAGILAGLGLLAYLIETVSDLLAHAGRHYLQIPRLALGLGLLVDIALALVVIGVADLRSARNRGHHGPLVPLSLATTLAWVLLMIVAGITIFTLELRYPRL